MSWAKENVFRPGSGELFHLRSSASGCKLMVVTNDVIMTNSAVVTFDVARYEQIFNKAFIA